MPAAGWPSNSVLSRTGTFGFIKKPKVSSRVSQTKRNLPLQARKIAALY